MDRLARHGLLFAALALTSCVHASRVSPDASDDAGSDAGVEASDDAEAGSDEAGLRPGDTLVYTTPKLVCGDPDCELCQQSILELDVKGQTPDGDFQAGKATLEYADSAGFRSYVTVFGTIGGSEVELSFDAGPPATAFFDATSFEDVPVGRPQEVVVRYDDGVHIQHADGATTDRYRDVAATLQIDEHDFYDSEHEAPLTRLRGAVEITEPGWSVRVPFEFDLACSYVVYTF